MLRYGGLKTWLALREQNREEAGAEAKPKAGKKLKPANPLPYGLSSALTGIIVLVFVFYPNLYKTQEVGSQALFAPSDAWQSSLLWLRDNSPEPLGDDGAYYNIYDVPAAGEKFSYPESAYGVTSWWDYGYWIMRIAHRLPSVNPGQSPKPIIKVANLLLSDDAAETQELVAELDSAYVVTDYAMTGSKFWAVVEWSGAPLQDYVRTYYLLHEGTAIPVNGFTPDYYRSLLVRLHNFDGKAVPEGAPVVVNYRVETNSRGGKVFVIPDINHIYDFPTYQEGLDYIESQTSGNYALIGISPFESPVPLEAVSEYNLIHSSEKGFFEEGIGMIPEVKIFEYTGS
jgi:dolichyl-diphosphooligosaccharide--protein glycosyltransferase